MKDEFYGVYNEYKDRRKAVIEAKNAVETENLKLKKNSNYSLERSHRERRKYRSCLQRLQRNS